MPQSSSFGTSRARAGAEALAVFFGRYEDRLVWLPEGWRFVRRTFTLAGRAQLETAKLQLNPSFAGELEALFPPRPGQL